MSVCIGLTGGIATGKSFVSGLLAREGAMIVDADRISHELTQHGGMALPLIREAFGPGVFTGDALDRPALAALVFGDQQALSRLNGIMHPLIRAEIERRLRAGAQADVPLMVLDAPLLYEAGLETLCDEVWCTWLPQSTQLARLMRRDGLSRAQALRRIRSQMSALEKRRRADRWIDTRGSMADTEAQALRLLGELKQRRAGETANAAE